EEAAAEQGSTPATATEPPMAHAAPADAPPAVRSVLSDEGRRLSASERTLVERFATPVATDALRVHTGSTAERAADELGARAFSYGNRLVVPDVAERDALFCHEAVHALQSPRGAPVVRCAPKGKAYSVTWKVKKRERAEET